MAKNINAILGLKDKLSPAMNKAARNVQKNSAKMAYSLRKTGKSVTKLGNTLTNKITKPAIGAAAAVGGIVLKKGWDRMIATDNARGKLLALGNTSEEVNAIMNNALESVTGTAFSLDSAATTAASAVAAGIKPGKDLTKYLSSVADTAAIAGVSMSDMGSIFNKVATSDKAQMDIINQLGDKGIPIMQWLAKETGKSAAEVQKMASEGKIDLATFRKAIEKNVGGAAKSMGSTTISAALDNIGAAAGRIGASFLGGSDDKNSFAGQLLGQLNDLEGFMSSLEPKAAEFGNKFGEMFSKGIEKGKQLYNWFMKLGPGAKKALVGIVLGAGPALKIIGGLTTATGKGISMFQKFKKNQDKIKAGFNLLKGAANPYVLILGALVAGGILLYKNWDKVKEKAQPLIDKFVAFKEAVQGAIDKVQGLIDKLKEWLGFDGKSVSVEQKTLQHPGSTLETYNSNPLLQAHNATGTSYWKGGPTWVGEHGPELLNLPSGSKITPNGKSMSMMGGGSINVSVNIAGNVIGNEAYANELGSIISSKIMSAMSNV